MQARRGESPAPVRASPRVLEPLALACGPDVDPGEDHGQFRRPELDALASGGVGELEGPGLESLVPDGQAVAVEVEDLDPIPAAVDGEEEMTGQGGLPEALLNQSGQAVESLAHVGGPGAKGDAGGRGGGGHGGGSARGGGGGA